MAPLCRQRPAQRDGSGDAAVPAVTGRCSAVGHCHGKPAPAREGETPPKLCRLACVMMCHQLLSWLLAHAEDESSAAATAAQVPI